MPRYPLAIDHEPQHKWILFFHEIFPNESFAKKDSPIIVSAFRWLSGAEGVNQEVHCSWAGGSLHSLFTPNLFQWPYVYCGTLGDTLCSSLGQNGLTRKYTAGLVDLCTISLCQIWSSGQYVYCGTLGDTLSSSLG